MTPPPREEGAALLAVLLLVAVMSALAVAALDKLHLAIRLAGNGAAAEQARAYAIGAETIALAKVDLLTDRNLGRTPGGWTNRAYPLPVPNGMIVARLADAGNCFNLNSTVSGGVPTALAARPAGIAQFAALMRVLGMPAAQAQSVAAATADWIDADAVPQPGGAEDDRYAQGPAGYRTGGTFLADPSELRAVAGVTPALYETLRPFVCALPTAELAPINVNTLDVEQAPLVAMLIPDALTLPMARGIIASRPEGGWSDASQFWKGPALAALTPLAEVQAQAGLKTRWFRLALDVELAGAEVQEIALIDGGLSPARVVARRWGDDL